MRNRWAAMALGVFIGVAAPAAQQQSANPAALPPIAAQPIPLYKVGLGTFTRRISSSNAEAQAYFDQGFQLMYSFGKCRGGSILPRGVEAGPRLRHLLLGRSLGLGIQPEPGDVGG